VRNKGKKYHLRGSGFDKETEAGTLKRENGGEITRVDSTAEVTYK